MPSSVAVPDAVFIPLTYPRLRNCALMLINICSKLYYLINDHLLTQFLPDVSVAFQSYNLRRRPHNLALPPRLTYLIDCNYINRMLYLTSY
jgi:hypothetical protein